MKISLLIISLWLITAVAWASPSERYTNAMNAIARIKGVLMTNRNPSKIDLYFVNIQREVAMLHFQSLIGEIKTDSYEGLVLKEVLSALEQVPLYDHRGDGNFNLNLFGSRILGALAKIPDTREIQAAIGHLETQAQTCEAKTQ